MTPRFHTLTISEVRRETADAVSVRFTVPEELRPAYAFRQGQFLTIKARVGGEELRRSYSVCVGTQDYLRNGELRVAIKAVADGRFSTFANHTFAPGQTLDVMTPDGRFFTLLDAGHAKHYVGFAGGSGITPLLSLIKTTLHTEPQSRFTLIYGNRAVGGIIFAEELEELKNRYLTRFRLYHVISDEPQEVALFHGLLNQEKCASFLDGLIPPDSIDEAFICGPAPMMDAAEAALHNAGVAPGKIHIERFGTPPKSNRDSPYLIAPGGISAASSSRIEVIIDGKTRTFDLPADGPAILDAALALGADLPYACKGGVCCTCRARVLEGKVRMDKNFTLEQKEIDQGFVLTCQSHPLTPKVVISFDER